MGRKQFTPVEQEAVWMAHDEVCYICKRPVGYLEMEIDHVVPVRLKDHPDQLTSYLADLGISFAD